MHVYINVYSDKEKKNKVAFADSGIFQDTIGGKTLWLPITGDVSGNSYWYELVRKRGTKNQIDLYYNYNNFNFTPGFGWWEEDGRVYTK